MDISDYISAVIEEDRCPVVICSLEHEILYMNKAAAARYARFGGYDLVGKSIFGCHNERSCAEIRRILDLFSENEKVSRVYTSRNDSEIKDVYMVALRNKNGKLIGYYEKHEYRSNETAEIGSVV